jgi:hypothetical protein
VSKKLAPVRAKSLGPAVAIRRANPESLAAAIALDAFVGPEAKESRKRRTEPGERVTVILPPDLLKRLRIAAIDEGCSVSHAVTEAVKDWLDGEFA